VHGVISALQVSYYPLGAQVMTLVLPLGLFIVVMIALYFVFSRPHTVPGHRPLAGARPVAPSAGAAPSIAAATGMPTATAAGGTEPLADRGTPPVVGARSEAATAEDSAPGGSAAEDSAAGDTGPDDPAATGNSEDPE
jgi:hypothetical protein